MNLWFVPIAQAAAAAASVTPTPVPVAAVGATPPGPPATPPGPLVTGATIGWSLLVLGLLVYGVYQHRQAWLGRANNAGNDATFRNTIAGYVLNASIWGLVLLASFIILLPFVSGRPLPNEGKEVFNALLPVFGTWVGTLLAFYFSRENFEAASRSVIASAAQTAAGGPERLQSTLAASKMKPLDEMVTLPGNLVGTADSAIRLDALVAHMEASGKDRLPIFRGNAAAGPGKCVVHRSTIEKFTAESVRKFRAEPPAAPAGGGAAPTLDAHLAGLSLHDLLVDDSGKGAAPPARGAVLEKKDLAPLYQSSFGLVDRSASLARAKSVMDNLSQALGTAGNCYDVFVTEGGRESDPVLGWITNDILNENARV